MKSRAQPLGIANILILVTLWLLSLGVIFFKSLTSSKMTPTLQTPILETNFYEPSLFLDGVQKNNAKPLVFPDPVLGAVVPHHLLAGNILSDIFTVLQVQKPQTVIILGPNHEEKGDGHIITSQAAWSTPHGVVHPHIELLNALDKELELEFSDEIMQQEHSISGLFPYVSFYLPDTNVVPLLISGKLTLAETDGLAKAISSQMDPTSTKALVIASIDFSHGLPSNEATQRDDVTINMINDRDFSGILQLENEYLDSPPVLVTLLKVTDFLDLEQSDILHHTNSGKLLSRLTAETTSYLTFFLYRER